MKDQTIDIIFELIANYRSNALEYRRMYEDLKYKYESLEKTATDLLEQDESELSEDEIYLLNLYRLGKIDKFGCTLNN